MLKSIVDVPLPEASGPEMGAGVSWVGDRVAVNRVTVVPAVVEGVELLDEQPAARSRPNAAMERRFMCCVTPFVIRRIYGSG
jgi:hypothetical protein